MAPEHEIVAEPVYRQQKVAGTESASPRSRPRSVTAWQCSTESADKDNSSKQAKVREIR